MRENCEYCNQAIKGECKGSCEALGLGRGHSRRKRAVCQGKERGRDKDVDDGDQRVDTTVSETYI